MAENVWAALVKGCLGLAHSRAGDLVGGSLKDAGLLVGSPCGTAKLRLDRLKKDIEWNHLAAWKTRSTSIRASPPI
jgi:hypothetical protein